ncbi:MAG: hypothetical protein EBR26_06765 [Microbacteriaceae bacterium]|nr:hypothetical protein [Microbacteriaceae bacterium]
MEQSVNDLRREEGTSLIWFYSVVALIVAVVLVLSLATQQYLFARFLKDYSEQLVLATLTLQADLESSKATAEALVGLDSKSPKSFEIVSLTSPDTKTLVLHSCATWQSEIALIPLSRRMCVISMAR